MIKLAKGVDLRCHCSTCQLARAAPDLAMALVDTLRELTACADQLASLGFQSRKGSSVSRAQVAARKALSQVKAPVGTE